MKTVALIHGFAGGKWHTKTFVKELEKAGLKVVGDTSGADVIIAHSTGCYIIPREPKAKLIFLIGIPYCRLRQCCRQTPRRAF